MTSDRKTVVVIGVNWVGDTVMTMPAVQAYRRRHPDQRLVVAVKPSVLPLWEIHDAPDALIPIEEGVRGLRRTVRAIKGLAAETAFVLPNSFRSALIPFLAGVPERIGVAGHGRRRLLTAVITHRPGIEDLHQAHEYIDLLVPETAGEPLDHPRLRVSGEDHASAEERLRPLPHPRIGMIPGAARGPSKQWPAAHFEAAARELASRCAASVVLFGTGQERALCEAIAAAVPGPVLNLAGQTGFRGWAAAMQDCDLMIANDSGGMHIAAALGRPVIALYGITDPDKTGPLGGSARVVQKSDLRGRDVGRDSAVARKALEDISPAEVVAMAETMLGDSND